MVTSGLIAGGGDALCQFLVGMMEKSKGGGVVAAVVVPYDIWRTARFTLLGTVVVAPSVHAWYTVLNRVVSGVTVTAVVRRVAADQLVFSPVFLSVRLDCGGGWLWLVVLACITCHYVSCRCCVFFSRFTYGADYLFFHVHVPVHTHTALVAQSLDPRRGRLQQGHGPSSRYMLARCRCGQLDLVGTGTSG